MQRSPPPLITRDPGLTGTTHDTARTHGAGHSGALGARLHGAGEYGIPCARTIRRAAYVVASNPELPRVPNRLSSDRRTPSASPRLGEGALDFRTGCDVEAWFHPGHRGLATRRSEALERTRRKHGATVKAQVVLGALNDNTTVAKLVEHVEIHPCRSRTGSSNCWPKPRMSLAAPIHQPIYRIYAGSEATAWSLCVQEKQ